MDIKTLLLIAGSVLIPVNELRGTLLFLYSEGYPNLLFLSAYCIVVNLLVAPLFFLFLNSLHKLFYKMNWYKKLFDKLVGRARKKIHDQVEKYGYVGLMFFVAIPLPITGAYTGTIGAWVLGLNKKRSILFISLGVVISGIIVSIIGLLASSGSIFGFIIIGAMVLAYIIFILISRRGK